MIGRTMPQPRSTTASLAFLFTCVLIACKSTPQPVVATEPYNIRANEALGIKLGMSFADYRKFHAKDTCTDPDLSTALMCFGATDPGMAKLTLADVPVDSYRLVFFRQQLVQIEYSLNTPLNMGLGELLNAFEGKFGKAKKTKDEYEGRYRWTNQISTLYVRYPMYREGMRETTEVSIRLEKEYQDMLGKQSEQKKNAAQKDL